MHFTKHHGAGNDFLVTVDLEGRRPLGPAVVQALCHRHLGVGADGVIRILAGRQGADLAMELRNADGLEAEMSGNGIRCLAQAAVGAGLVSPPAFSVATAAGIRTVEYRPGDRSDVAEASVDMGKAELGPDQAQQFGDRRARQVDMGNPHLVLLGPDPSGLAVGELGPQLQAIQTGGINVEFVTLGPGTDELTMRVWERGVGETLACGTGACAAAAAAHSWGLVGEVVTVHNPGGSLRVALGSDGIVLAGPTRLVADVEVDLALLPAVAAVSPTQSAFTDTLISRTIRERIVLVGVTFPHGSPSATGAGLDELALLVDTAGADVVERVVQRRDRPDPATYVGKGKAEELLGVCLAVDADTVVFDDELSPAQQRNLEKILGRTAIDRTAVILDIFAQNARTPEGKAQVELALLRYRLPRLRGRGTSLSQQAGGIGTRGPGETQLEVDRRRLVRRMTRLESDLRRLDATRRTQRRTRGRSRHRTVSLVGYTNAGKSTLLNRLCDADVLVENRLFSTLDPRTRQLALPGGETVLLTDTVGFVRKLPHQVVEAFRSTLEVVCESDLIAHVVDGSAPDLEGQISAVRTVLAEIGADGLPELLVVNKVDALGEAGPDAEEDVARLLAAHEGSITMSARTGTGIPELLTAMGDRLRVADRVVELVIPWARGDVLAAVHREGEIVCEVAGEETTRIQVVLDDVGKARFREFVAS